MSKHKTILAFLLLFSFGCLHPSYAQNGTIAPWYDPTFLNAAGTGPAALGFLCTYAAGTTTPATTYSNITRMSANANPITLNAAGQPVSGSTLIQIYLTPSTNYKFVLYAAGTGNTCNGSDVGAEILTKDNVPSGGGDITGSGSTNTIPKFSSSTVLGNSSITDVAGLVSFTGLATQTNQGVPYFNSSKNLLTDNSYFHYDSTNKRLYVGFGPLSGLSGSGQILASGAGGLLVATANSDASTLAINAVTSTYTTINSGRTGSGTRLPLAIFTGGAEAMRLTTDPFMQLSTSYTGSNKSASGAVALRNNAGALEYSENAGSWTGIGGAGGWTDDGTTVRLTTSTDRVIIGGSSTDVTGITTVSIGNFSGFTAASAATNASTLSMTIAATGCGCASINAGKTGSGSYLPFIIYTGGGSGALIVTTSGTLTAPTYGAGTATFDMSGNITSVSDERLKNIQGKFNAGLNEILKIDPIVYKWNAVSKLETKYDYAGFSAQNVQAAIPLAVGQNEDGYLSLQDRAIMAAMVNAIKELNQRVKDLESREGK